VPRDALADQNMDPLLDALNWLVAAATGTTATIVAILGISMLGVVMLRGHFEWRRAATAILAIFVIIGAHNIALGLYSSSGAEGQIVTRAGSTHDEPQPKPAPHHDIDPYAGASVPIR